MQKQKSQRARRTTKGRRFPPEILTDGEVRRLLAVCDESTFTGMRNRALITVLYRGGLRISEALALLPKDIDTETGAVRVLWAKGGTSRVVGIDRQAMAILADWLAYRQARRLYKADPVFCSADGRPLRKEYIRVLFPRLAARAGLERRFHAHALRHTHAAQLRAENVDIGIISKQLGHCSIATTAHYLDHIAPWSVVEVMRERRWPASSS